MAFNVVSKCWTYDLTNSSITITSDFSFTILSILASSGTVSILGAKIANGIPSNPITLQEGQALTISDGDGSVIPIDGITIITTGTASLIGR